MTLSPSDYLRVRVASQQLELAREKRQRLTSEAARLEEMAGALFTEALRAAGVDPAKTWRFDDAAMTLEEVIPEPPPDAATEKAPTSRRRRGSAN